ncbi:hypothetical protein CANMA_004144 [Candida margitis]|uniref:uncharacterized protein n=1 Tax=Candida margitis TaxID=1775924 RepID=UPI0022264609|nr:uncharacterized protein CANMA_004144 [Candida margitis]KAI5959126.1 hypothetical protein CANMA_004144 [Candida margitis]
MSLNLEAKMQPKTMPPRLPSIVDSDLDSLYAPDEKPEVFQNSNDLPLETLVNHILPLPQDISGRAVKIPGTSKPGFTEIYRNGAFPNGVKRYLLPELNTYHAIFESAVKRHADRPCLSHHEYDYENEEHKEKYVSLNYSEVNDRKTNFASGLLFLLETNPYKNLDLESHQKIVNHARDYKSYDEDEFSFVATFYSGNRPEWILSDLACSSNSITSTALYDTLGPASSKFILETTQSPVVICAKNKIEALIKMKAANSKDLESLITLVSMDPLNIREKKTDANLVQLAQENNIKLYDFNQVVKIGEIFPRAETTPTSETTFTLTFTSGTTGANPKGVVLSQRSVASAIQGYSVLLPHHKDTKEFAFLPLAHIFERHMSASMFLCGGAVGFPRLGGTPQTLFEDLKLFKPTFFACVPRIFSKMETIIKASTVDSSSRINRALYSQAIETKRSKQAKSGGKGEHFIYDQTLIRNLRSRFGFDNMETCYTGGAPSAPESIEFLKASLGIGISQGYGLSESFAGIIMALPFHTPSIGTCGSISPMVEARLRELPEMGYYLNDKGGPRGELQLRGPQMFSHYFKNPEETKKTIDADGWFSTGDVAQITNEGWFIIIDRVKNFFKLAQGEYVTPEKVENLYLTYNSILTQVFAHGDFTQSFLVGIVGVDPVNIVSFLTEKCNIPSSGVDTEDKILEVCNRREIRTRILLQLNTNIGSILNGFEKLANIYIEFEPLRLEREVVTPTSKLRRPIASKFFKPQIDAMYKEGSILKDLKL